jgi:hypothetical protein
MAMSSMLGSSIMPNKHKVAQVIKSEECHESSMPWQQHHLLLHY